MHVKLGLRENISLILFVPDLGPNYLYVWQSAGQLTGKLESAGGK